MSTIVSRGGCARTARQDADAGTVPWCHVARGYGPELSQCIVKLCPLLLPPTAPFSKLTLCIAQLTCQQPDISLQSTLFCIVTRQLCNALVLQGQRVSKLAELRLQLEDDLVWIAEAVSAIAGCGI